MRGPTKDGSLTYIRSGQNLEKKSLSKYTFNNTIIDQSNYEKDWSERTSSDRFVWKSQYYSQKQGKHSWALFLEALTGEKKLYINYIWEYVSPT